ncbi:GNAT family N-acetyltransferase [Methylocella sp.]|uniref:GNAT family N-acetyltransferase n=1 Tax=Methylocella sp. TaxID=1978226 RepID=UPI0037840DE1
MTFAQTGAAAAIRPAAPGDAGLVLAFVRELADYESLSHEVLASEADLDAALFGPAPQVFVAIAEVGGEPAGFALWFHTFSSFTGRRGAWLEDLYVRPAFRKRGLGRALIVHVARLCAQQPGGRFEWSVLDWNAPAIRFYRSLGARVMNEWLICRTEGEALDRLAAAAGEP